MHYPGGKGKCFQRLINLMPRHRVYIESHLGGGAVLRHKRPAEVSIGVDIDARVIERWRAIPTKLCELVHADAASYLANFSYSGDELIYADPPYVASTRRRAKIYRHEYSVEDHIRLLEMLKRVPCSVMLSGYDNELYAQSLRGWRRANFFAKTHTEVRQECVWMNYEPPTDLHDGSYLGNTFRDRQTIKRRHARVEHRFAAMDVAERNELLRRLNQRFGTQMATT